MSNLKLPNLSYENLATLAPKNGAWKKIGYATMVRKSGDCVEFKHHDSVIARIYGHMIELNPCGYHTRTTSDRLHRIARDNNTNIRVGMRQGVITATGANEKLHVLNVPRAFFRKS